MDEQMRELTNDAVIDLVKEAGLDWHAGFNLDDENRYGTLVRLAFNLGAALSQPAAQGTQEPNFPVHTPARVFP